MLLKFWAVLTPLLVCLVKKYGLSASELSLENLKAQITEPMTFTSATDGNHGRGIAWSAEKLGQNAVIYMPVGTAEERVRNIQKLGAEVIVTDCNYDDTVRIAYETSQKNGWEFVQDTAWEATPTFHCGSCKVMPPS